jgi:uncharacterized protein YeaO (DUF488 family)
MKLTIKRAYDEPSPADGFRILVDRLWPRGLTKEKARIDLWLKELGPSTELRKWFGHDPEKYPEFRTRYLRELEAKSDLIDQIRDHLTQGPVTLIYAASDTEHNQAVVLWEYLTSPLG